MDDPPVADFFAVAKRGQPQSKKNKKWETTGAGNIRKNKIGGNGATTSRLCAKCGGAEQLRLLKRTF
jgi:hypothetical protein